MYGTGLFKSIELSAKGFVEQGLLYFNNFIFVGYMMAILYLSGCGIGILIGNLVIYYTVDKINPSMQLFYFGFNFTCIACLIGLSALSSLISGASNMIILLYVEDPERFECGFDEVTRFQAIIGEIEKGEIGNEC